MAGEAAVKQEPEARLMRAIRCEIVKPVSESWDETGPLLRTIRSISHRLYTAAALAAVRVDRASRLGVPEIDPKTKKGVPPATAAYRELEIELEQIRSWAAKKRNPGEEQATLARLAELELPGGLKSCISQSATAGFQKWKKAAQKERVPTWKHGAPIPCRAAESSFRLDESGRVIMSVQLRPTGRVSLLVKAGRGSHWARLRSLATGADGVKHGDVKLTYSEREKKWYAFVAFSEPMPEPPALDPDVVMVLHRGQRNLLVAATNRGHYSVLATGNKLREFKRRMAGRRRELQAVTRTERGNGAHGHGRNRRYDLADRLSERESNFTRTLCQQLGARVVELAKHWGAGTVLIEEYGGIAPDDDRGKRMVLERFPNHELKTRIEWSLRKAGMTLGEYEHAYMSRTCPQCGNTEAQHNPKTGVFHCRACVFDRPVDVVSSIFALRRACDGYAGTWEERLALEKRLSGRIKDRKPTDDDGGES